MLVIVLFNKEKILLQLQVAAQIEKGMEIKVTTYFDQFNENIRKEYYNQ